MVGVDACIAATPMFLALDGRRPVARRKGVLKLAVHEKPFDKTRSVSSSSRLPFIPISAILAVRGVLRRTGGARPVRRLGSTRWYSAPARCEHSVARAGEPSAAELMRQQ